MQTLVKTCMTLQFSDRIDWTDVKNRIVGVHVLEDESFKVVFEDSYSTTTIVADNYSKEVKMCTIYKDQGGNIEGTEHNRSIMRRLLDKSNNKYIRIIKTICSYSVVRVKYCGKIDTLLTEYYMRGSGHRTMLDFEVHDALFVSIFDVTWQIFDSQRIFAITGRINDEYSSRNIEKSWLELKKWICI